ncbi:MAG: M1 family metallopeptidase [Myxococcales bacterium]|nr:M1 family metallopeptidase [Myxococcales bacterium]
MTNRRHWAATLCVALLGQCTPSTNTGSATTGASGASGGAQTTASTPDASVTVAAVSVEAPREDGRLPALAAPLGYEVSLEVDPNREDFRGKVRVRMRMARASRAVVMHARELDVREVWLLDASGARSSRGQATLRASAHGRGTPEELVVSFDRELSGDVQVELEYVGRFNPSLRSLYRVQQRGKWYAFTQFEPNDARRAFPCFDEPAFKVPWKLDLTVPAGAVALANMPEASRETLADRRVRVRFRETPPTPSYLIAFAVGPFDVVEHAPVTLEFGGERVTVPLRGVATEGQGALVRESLDVAAAHLEVLSRYFDRNYPYPKLDLVAVPEFGAGAMENPGLVTFREEMLLIDPARATTSARRGIAGIIAHELAHQWFGNLVTMRWWDDLWLNEGFATWATSRVLDTWRPEMGSRVESVRSRAWAMDQDSLPTARIVRQPVRSTSEAEEAFDGITYTKGAAFLRMLETAMGEDAFRAGIRRYIRAHAWGNATASDLFDDLQSTGGIDVSTVASSFLDFRGVPIVTAELQCTRGAAPTITLTQDEYRPLGSARPENERLIAAHRWAIPLCVEYDAGGNRSARACTILREASARITLDATASSTVPTTGASTPATTPDAGASRASPVAPPIACPRWIHPNAGESAYVRYALTEPVRALFEPARWRTLDRSARVGLVDAAWAQLRAGTLPVDQYLSIVTRIRDERDRLVLDSLSSALSSLVSHHAQGEVRTRLRALAAQLFRPTLARLGWAPRPNDTDDDKLLRRSAIGVLGWLSMDEAALREANRYATEYLRAPASVPSDLALLVLPIASMRADNARLDALLARLRAQDITPQERSTLQVSLVTFTDPTVLRRGLDQLLTDVVRQQDVLRLLWTASTHPERRAVAHAWIRDHYDGIVRRTTEETAVRMAGIIGDTCAAPERDAWVAFWTPRARNAEGAERAIREGVDSSTQCEAFDRAIAPGLQRWR